VSPTPISETHHDSFVRGSLALYTNFHLLFSLHEQKCMLLPRFRDLYTELLISLEKILSLVYTNEECIQFFAICQDALP